MSQEVQILEDEHVKHGMEHAIQVFIFKKYPVTHDLQTLEVEQSSHGDLQIVQVPEFR